MCNIFQVFIEFVIILLQLHVLVFKSRGKEGGSLNPPAKDQTHTFCIGRQSLNLWTTREVPPNKPTFAGKIAFISEVHRSKF